MREVSQGEWLEVLNQVGYGRSVLVEVPLPPEGSHPALEQATRELASASTSLALGLPRDTVAACRRALDALAHAVGEDPGSYNLVEVVKKNPNLDKRARFAAIRKALTIVADASVHGDPNAAAIEWHYEDALAILTETTAVLRYHASRLPPPAPLVVRSRPCPPCRSPAGTRSQRCGSTR